MKIVVEHIWSGSKKDGRKCTMIYDGILISSENIIRGM